MNDFRALVSDPPKSILYRSLNPTFDCIYFVLSYSLLPFHLRITETPRLWRRRGRSHLASPRNLWRWIRRPWPTRHRIKLIAGTETLPAYDLYSPISACTPKTRPVFFHIYIRKHQKHTESEWPVICDFAIYKKENKPLLRKSFGGDDEKKTRVPKNVNVIK